MNSIGQVNEMVAGWIKEDQQKDEIVVNAAKAEVGWDYVWGATGQKCTPSQRRSFVNRQRKKGLDKEAKVTISKCQVLNGKKSSCDGCKFYCNGGGTLIDDCQGFVKQITKRVGISLSGGGATSLYNNMKNWDERGKIKDLPEQVCCIFWTDPDDKNVKSHIGVYIKNGMMAHCSGSVKVEKLSAKCTDYALIKGLEGTVPVTHETIKRGSRGPAVIECQTDLILLGYDVGPKGADGIFGAKTEEAVKKFQAANGLPADGVVGKETWEALDAAVPPEPGPGPEPGPEPEPPGPEPGPEPVTRPTIKRGSKGPYVVECQEDLIKLGYDVGPKGADGIFGAKTEAAVKQFQREHNDPDGNPLKVDGIVGQKTWGALLDAVEKIGN